MTNHSQDAGIPVLTEIIPAPSPLPSPVPSSPLQAQEDITAHPPAPATPTWDEHEWNRLERDVHERVLRQILDRVDFVLEQRVRDSLADVLQTSVDRLASEIRTGLHQSIKEAVARAVTQEIAKVQGSKK